ncbi:cytochrome P450 [Xylariomycetidae sp. FL2044]|nr:cytochrome P450 [Xylariomycetidae sp. FL2044]
MRQHPIQGPPISKPHVRWSSAYHLEFATSFADTAIPFPFSIRISPNPYERPSTACTMAVILTVISVFSALVIGWAVYSLTLVTQNYLVARNVGIPLRVIPISHGNPFWMIVDRKIVNLVKRLPWSEGNFTRYNWRGWEVGDRYRSHLEMGDVYMQVTSEKNWLYVCNPESLMDIFRRKTDFPRPLEIFEMLNIFGPNLSTVDGAQWKKQRKITSSCFNEHNNALVWSESLSQAGDMARYWVSSSPIRSTADDTRTLSLHVLSRAGFGKSFKFQGHNERAANALASDYKGSLQVVLDNCVLIMALGKRFLSKPWLPMRLQRVSQACVAFEKYMTDLYSEVRDVKPGSQPLDRNLMTSLIRASEDESKVAGGLSEQEIYGNMFVFNFAGHDTTAHTLTFVVMFLAANPAVQDWLAEELQHVFGSRSPDEWDYTTDFPRLKRCLAVLMETVRLYTPVPVAKWTGESVQTLRVDDRTITLPPNTMVIPSYAAMHTHPKYWGADSLSWRPSRWIKVADDSAAGAHSISDEEVMTPARGTFFPWSEGERNCPGKKFSQVEFVATLAALFRDWRVDPVPQPSQTVDDARRQILKTIEKDSAQVLLLQMLHPERIPLVWRAR